MLCLQINCVVYTKRDEWRSGRWDDDTAAAWSMSDTLDFFFLVYIYVAHYNEKN
jgi:hypothetical protein